MSRVCIPRQVNALFTRACTALGGIQAIVHTHQPMATVMGIGARPSCQSCMSVAKLVETPVPVWRCAQLVTDHALGDDLARTLGAHALVLLQGHGVASAAATVPEAALQAIHLEQLAEANWRVLAMGRQPQGDPI